jgi:hypothetical protein
MADEVKDDQAEILEALKDEGTQDTPKESPPEEKPEAVEPKAEEPEVAKEEGKEEEETPESPPEEPEAKEPTKANERKEKLNTEIRDLVSKRNALKSEVEKANAEVYQPATENELTGQPKDPENPDEGVYTVLEAKVEAMRQAQEMEKYNTQVAEAQLTISHESEKVLNDFPWSNAENPEYDEELATEAAELLQNNLILDPNTNQVIGSNISPYSLYKTINRAHQSSTLKGQIKGREDTEEMLANADSPGNTAPIKKAKDPILDILASDDY